MKYYRTLDGSMVPIENMNLSHLENALYCYMRKVIRCRNIRHKGYYNLTPTQIWLVFQKDGMFLALYQQYCRLLDNSDTVYARVIIYIKVINDLCIQRKRLLRRLARIEEVFATKHFISEK